MLKMACIKDAQLFYLLEQHAEQLRATSFQVIHHSCSDSPFLGGYNNRCSIELGS